MIKIKNLNLAGELVKKYFREFFPKNFSAKYIQALPEIEQCIEFKISDGSRIETWSARKQNGELKIQEKSTPDARCTYLMNQQTFLNITGGLQSPQTAYFCNKLSISGDILFALQIGALLEVFFREHPYAAHAQN